MKETQQIINFLLNESVNSAKKALNDVNDFVNVKAGMLSKAFVIYYIYRVNFLTS